jgi:hypothetical protein
MSHDYLGWALIAIGVLWVAAILVGAIYLDNQRKQIRKELEKHIRSK